ncbi:MAG: acetyl-CoA carboxylase biotin carboxylase subunit [Elusimicrobiota bacterium]
MFSKILVANRGEIAVRVIRACREMGVRTVAVYSEADRACRHLGMADEAVCIGPGPAAESYLKAERIVAAARLTGAQAIHPGYGFLAEAPAFARACAERGIVFIGPPADAISVLGNKAAARELAGRCGVPVVPGTAARDPHGPSDGGAAVKDLIRGARRIGLPVMVKAAAGGGGKGLRVVREDAGLGPALERAGAEAKAAFGDGSLYVEKLVERPRHVEIQIMADRHGSAVAAVERDCSVQRRHQKLIEESPSPAVTPRTRRRLQEAALRIVKACRYANVGTVEFLLDRDGDFYFMEVNTRLQVEHPVTETVTGLDLVAEQIRLAAGERLSFDQARASEIRCHSIEHRINAEDPDRDFAPCPGRISSLELPAGPGVRVDTHLYAGYTVPTFYDSLLAKLIVGADTRRAAISRALRALGEFRVDGIATTVPFHQRVLRHARFASGDFDTRFADELRMEEPAEAAPPPQSRPRGNWVPGPSGSGAMT